MRRNPPSSNPHRVCRDLARMAASGALASVPGGVAALRARLTATRGYGPGVHPDYLRLARRQGGWCFDRDLTGASDAQILEAAVRCPLP